MSTATMSDRRSVAAAGKPTTYTVRALDPASSTVIVEKVEAVSADDARAMMTLRGLTPLSVQAKAAGLSMEIPGFKKRAKPTDFAVFARMLATLVHAGLPLLRALTLVTKQTENLTLREVLEKVTMSVQSGKALSAAMADHPQMFPPLMINLVRAGEVGGYLDEALTELADSTEAEVELRGEIKAASTYPIVVMIIGVIAAIGMILFIVPIFAGMFSDLGGQLPLPTRIVMGMSSVLRVGGAPIAVVVGAGVFWWRANKNTDRVRAAVDPIKLRLPVFGPLLRKIAIARFARNLSMMVTSGVQLLEGLSVVSETAGNVVVGAAVTKAAESVRKGESLSAHLGDGGVFPDMVVQMVAIGEDSGSLAEMLGHVARFYDREVMATTKKLGKLIEPFLIVGMGIMLGGLIIAMYLPMFQIFNLIK